MKKSLFALILTSVALAIFASPAVGQAAQTAQTPVALPPAVQQNLNALQHLQLDNKNASSSEFTAVGQLGDPTRVAALEQQIREQVQVQTTVNFKTASTTAIARFEKAGLSKQSLDQIQTAADKATASGSDDDRARLAELINHVAQSQQVMCNVLVQTKAPGAIVRYQTYTEHRDGGLVHTFGEPTNASQQIAIGIYYFWTERGGKATSDKTLWYSVMGDSYPITIEETP